MNSPIHVLFIEDNPGDARLVKEELHGANSRVTIQLEWVDRLETGMEYLAANRPQAVLLDLNLPDSQGLETLRRVLDSVPSLPVIVMTGQTDEELGIRAMQAGAQDYLVKGQVDGNLLARAIQYAIQRKQTELQLSDALEFTEHIVTSSPMGIFTYRLGGECVSVNAAAARMVGATVELLRNQNFHHIESWKRSGLYDMAKEAISSKRLVADDVHVLTTFGRDAWYRAQFITFRSGEEELLLMMFEDITERKKAEAALKASERFNRETLDALISNIAILDENGTIVAVNRSWREFAQANKADPGRVSEGVNYLEVCDRAVGGNAEEATLMAAGIRTVMCGEQESYSVEYPCHSPLEKRWFMARVTKFNGEGPLRIVVAHEYITERKLAEVALRESEENYRQLFEAESDAILLIDNQTGRILQANNAACALYGYSQGELLTKKNVELSAEPEQTREVTHKTPIFPDDVISVPLRYHRRKDGMVFPVEITGRFFRHQGRPVHIAAIRDITNRKQSEAALEASEKRFRAWIENSSDIVTVIDSGGLIQYESTSIRSILGYAPEDLLGKSAFDFVHPDDREKIAGMILGSLQNPEAVTSAEFRFLHRDGSWKVLEAVGRSYIDEHGLVLGLINSRDITDRKQAEAALKASEQRYRELAENFPNGVVTVYNKDLVQVFNAGLELKSSGYTAEDFLGKHFTELASPETWEIARPQLLEAFEGRVSGYEAFGLDGQYYSVNVAPLHDANGEINEVLVVSQNITSLKNAQSSLQEKEWLLSEAQRIGHIGSWSYDIPGDSIKFSDEMYRLLDVVADAFNHDSQGLLALIYPSDRTAVSRWMQDVRKGVPAKEISFRVFHRNGELRYIQCMGAVRFDGAGNVKHFIGTMQDVTDRKNAEIQIEQHIRHLTALSEIDRAIISSFDQRHTLDVILRQTISQLQLDAADVLLMDEDGRVLRFAAGQGFRTKRMESVRLRLGESYAGRVAQERHMIRIMDLEESVADPSFDDFVKAEGFVSYIGVPLFVKGQVRGVLELYQKTVMHPYSDWLDFLYTLAGQAAIAIGNADMFENLQRSNRELSQAYDATIEGWSRALDLRDRETEGHTQRVTDLTLELARRMDVEEARLVHVRRGALLHDIGKLGVPDDILFKTEGLSPVEWEVMKRHPELAYEMLSPIAYLKPALAIPYYHHERWDGSGYPIGLKGGQIPLEARIFAVVDVWDALRSDRPYRRAWDMEKVIEYITGQAGFQFDPRVVECFLKLVM